MIENPGSPRKHDRLTAFLAAFDLTAAPALAGEPCNLVVVDAAGNGNPTHLVYRPRGGAGLAEEGQVLAAAAAEFCGTDNPLVGALPDELRLPLESDPPLQALATLIVGEAGGGRCGGPTVLRRVCEAVVVLAIRKAIDRGTVHAGLLMGLAHPELHPALVAIHDAPARQWRVADMAERAGMSRSRFVAVFAATVGTTPGDYLTTWRVALGRAQLRSGRSVKEVAAAVGFGSAAAFSRAHSRLHDAPPSSLRQAQQGAY